MLVQQLRPVNAFSWPRGGRAGLETPTSHLGGRTSGRSCRMP